MGKQKIGEDIIKKKAGAIISTPKEHEEYEKFLEEREKQKKQEEIKEKMKEEGQITDEQLAKQREQEADELAEAKEEGKLKSVHVREHYRSKPKIEEEEEQ